MEVTKTGLLENVIRVGATKHRDDKRLGHISVKSDPLTGFMNRMTKS